MLNELRKQDNDDGECFSREAFLSSVAAVQSVVPQMAERSVVEYNSIDELFSDCFRDKRLQFSPQQKYRRPLTTSHTLGWFRPSEHETVERFPKLTCEETKFASDMVKAGVIS